MDIAPEVALCLLLAVSSCAQQNKPNIIFILADDLGWNDVSYHGSNQIPTPNIDALAFSGVILNSYYTPPLCTPSRAAILTGRHPIHTGMQHEVIYGMEPWGLGLGERTLAEMLKEQGYDTRLVGKWHLGHHHKEYTPTFRGFDSFFGFWSGHLDYYDHNAEENPRFWGHDLKHGLNETRQHFGDYLTTVLTHEAVDVIHKHDTSRPLFLLLAHAAPHAANPSIPLQAPEEVVAMFPHINDLQRRRYAGMVWMLDQSVGVVTSTLAARGMLENSIIVFVSDNGGAAGGYNQNEASNWPLRGGKDTSWEGGVRAAAILWSPLLDNTPRVSTQIVHAQDWVPTLMSAINCSHALNGTKLDGRDIWRALNEPDTKTYSELLLQIDRQRNISALRLGDWKLVRGTTWDGRYDVAMGISGRSGDYDVELLYSSDAARSIGVTSRPLPQVFTVMRLREEATIYCKKENASLVCDAVAGEICLFNLITDPCESHNLARDEPELVQQMLSILEEHDRTLVPPRNKPGDPASNPKYWGYNWVNWKDFPAPPGVNKFEKILPRNEEYKI